MILTLNLQQMNIPLHGLTLDQHDELFDNQSNNQMKVASMIYYGFHGFVGYNIQPYSLYA